MALTHAQKTGLEAAILAYLAAAEGGRFARTVAAFKEELQSHGGNDDNDHLAVSGAVLEKAWACVHHNLKSKSKSNIEAFFNAIESGDLAEVQLYVGIGVDVPELQHSYFEEKWELWRHEVSPLFWAARHNRLDIVRYFVEQGVNKDYGCSDDTCPLSIAAEFGHFAVVQYLVEQGVDKEQVDVDGMTPLYMAALGGYVEVVQYLIEQGADKERADNEGDTPVYTAAQKGHFAVLQCLLEQGADMDKATGRGVTPLMTACYNGHADITEYLLDRGCDIDRTDNDGYTALHWAALGDRLDVAQLLFRYGVKLDARDNGGRTPAEVATSRGHHAFADAIRAEEIRRRDHGFKRDRSTIEGTEEHEAAKRPRVEEAQEAVDESDDDDDDDDDEEEKA